MIRADGQIENKGKPRPKHLNSFDLSAKDRAAFSCARPIHYLAIPPDLFVNVVVLHYFAPRAFL